VRIEEPLARPAALLCLRVAADADPQALARVLERFQNLNVLPRRVLAEFGVADVVHIRVDILGIPEERLSLIAAKISQSPSILAAYWHYA